MNIIETNFTWNGTFTNGENKPDKIVIHHAEANGCTVEDIHRWHLNNGWAGIGYHYYVRKDGSIYRGRKELWRGSHCPSANYNSIGICFEGKYDVDVMPEAQFNAGISLIFDIRTRYGILPLFKHGQLYATSCPGAKFPFDRFVNGNIEQAPTPITNTTGGDYMSKVYQNGSTIEIVYQTSACTEDKKIGSLDPNETATCIGEVDGKAIILYKITGTNTYKVGFVKWLGGIQ